MMTNRTIYALVMVLFISLTVAVFAARGGDASNKGSGSLAVETSKSEAGPFARAVSGLIDHVAVEKAIVHENLAVFPLAWKGEPDPENYATLESSSEKKTVTVTELGEGTVPRLKLENKNQKPLFLMTGEVLTGARQDRILAHDILVGPKQKELVIPVYCVEAGRWTSKSKAFDAAKNVVATGVRGAAAQKAAQGKVWKEVGEVNLSYSKAGSGSIQQSFEDEKSQKERAAYREAMIRLPEGKAYVGVVVAVNGKVQNADLFSSPDLFKAMWPKLLESYALEAHRMRDEKAPPPPRQEDARDFLANIFEAHYRELSNPGLGAEFMIEAKDTAGSILVHQGRVIHLAVFPFEKPPEKKKADPPPPRPRPGVEEQIQQVLNVNDFIQQAGGYGAPGQRSDSFKKNGMEFDIKNPKMEKMETRP